MTLVISLGMCGNFVSMTSDKRKVLMGYWYYPDTNEYKPAKGVETREADGDHIKTVKVSDYALFGSGGSSDLGIYIREELLKITEASDDLGDCKLKLEQVIEEGRRIVKTNSFLSLLNEEDGIGVIVVGFYRDKTIGRVSFKSGKDTTVEETKTNGEGHQVIRSMIPPVASYHKWAKDMLELSEIDEAFIGEDGELVDDIPGAWLKQAIKKTEWAHGLVSYNHPKEVSHDGELHVLKMQDDGTVGYEVSEFETSHIHRFFENQGGVARS